MDHIKRELIARRNQKTVFSNVIWVPQAINREMHLDGASVSFIFRFKFILMYI